jgi:AcrR family transcriptional regulator
MTDNDTKAQIIAAAAQQFVDLGYKRATTRKIAQAADVTEVTLFRHFGSKQNLFTAVLNQYALQPDSGGMFEMVLGEDYRQDMLQMGQYTMRIMQERRDAMRMMLCEAAHFPELQEVLGQAPRQMRDMIANYLQQRIDAGDIVPRDPNVMAQGFLGFFFSYTMAFGFLDQAMALEPSLDEMVAEFVDLFVQGTLI